MAFLRKNSQKIVEKVNMVLLIHIILFQFARYVISFFRELIKFFQLHTVTHIQGQYREPSVKTLFPIPQNNHIAWWNSMLYYYHSEAIKLNLSQVWSPKPQLLNLQSDAATTMAINILLLNNILIFLSFQKITYKTIFLPIHKHTKHTMQDALCVLWQILTLCFA